MNSPIKWRGGKRNLRNHIIEMIPEHHCYVEPFFGAGWVLFQKEKSKVEVINDIDRNVITFFNVIKNDYENFKRMFNTYLVSRDEFTYLKELEIEDLSDLMIAYRFYYINKNSFAGDMSSFNSYYRDKPYLNDSSLKLIGKAHERLKNVWIENKDYKEIIYRFDKENTFFYLDPPYYDTNNGSYHEGKSIDFMELKNVLLTIKGKFIFSINDCPFIRDTFKNFDIQEVDVQYNISKDINARGKYKELIIKNY